jgi:hypothetical protein
MACDACERAQKAATGLYRLSCLECCVRLVMSARPNREAAKAMLAVIDMQRSETITRELVVSEIKKRLEKK